MKVRTPYEPPAEKRAQSRRAARLEWITLGFLASIIAVVGFAAGSSQAMRTAWIEDMLSLVPPVAFLVAARVRKRPPDERFPYGYRRAVTLAYLVAAVALSFFGAYLLVESALVLIRREHPTIGVVEIFGRQIWLGWLMIAALLYSAVPPVILGYMKLPLARDLHAKVLQADADMSKADWMTALAGILGITGVALGYWWADALAAGVISLDIVKDGFTHLRRAANDIMDERPHTVLEDEPEDLPDRLRARLKELIWVRDADVRLREEGDTFTGEIYVVPAEGSDILAGVEEVRKVASDLDWRIYDVAVMPVRSLGSS